MERMEQTNRINRMGMAANIDKRFTYDVLYCDKTTDEITHEEAYQLDFQVCSLVKYFKKHPTPNTYIIIKKYELVLADEDVSPTEFYQYY